MLAAALLGGAGCYTSDKPASVEGRAVFTITDAATELTGVTAVNLTVDKVEVHSATEDWVTVSTATKQYDLLQLKATNSAALLADVNLAAGTYEQVRLHISKVMVIANGKTTEAKLPSTTLKIVGNLTIVGGQTSTASLDFMVDKSLHLANGTYILAPVVRLLTTKGADVSVSSTGKVEVSGGKVESDETVGMDEKGEVKEDFELDDDLEIDAKGMIKVDLD